MVKIKIRFNFEENGGSSYQVCMNGIRYTVNSENKEIDIEQAPETEWKLSFKQSKMIAAFVITVFFAALYIV